MTKKIKAIIVDDEFSARENLRYLLQNYCTSILVVAEARSVDSALIEIEKHKPNVVFLDIEMPQKNGFQLLEAYKKETFQVVFVTAYDRYAIRAFQVAALDYLLKPIDVERLKDVVKRIDKYAKGVNNRLELLKENNKSITKIAVPYKSDYAILDINNIVCVEADRMYSILHLKNGKTYTTSKKLSYYETLLIETSNFVRIHRSWLLNINQEILYSKKEKQVSINDFILPIGKSYKTNFEAIYMK